MTRTPPPVVGSTKWGATLSAIAVSIGIALYGCSSNDTGAPAGPDVPSTTRSSQTSTTIAPPLDDLALETTHEPAGSPYEDRLDLDRVVAAGNSCGGITALGLAATDERVKGVFVLSGSSTIPGASREQVADVMGAVDVPVGYAVGAPDRDVARPQAVQDLELLGDGIGGMVASRDSGDHVMVSTTPAIFDEVGDMSINWLDLVLNGNETALRNLTETPCGDCPPGTWTVEFKDLEALNAS